MGEPCRLLSSTRWGYLIFLKDVSEEVLEGWNFGSNRLKNVHHDEVVVEYVYSQNWREYYHMHHLSLQAIPV